MDFAKMRYMQDYGKVHYTYSKDYLSGAFILVDPVKQAKKEKKESMAKWLTKEGFQWPKARTPEEINSMPEKLPSASYPVAEAERTHRRAQKLQHPLQHTGTPLRNPEGVSQVRVRM